MNIFIEHVWLLRHDTRHPRQKECTTLPFKILLVSIALLRKRWTPSLHPIFSRLQSFPVSGSFPKSQLFTSGRQIIGASASVLPMNIQGWFPLGFTGLISLQAKGLSRVFSKRNYWVLKTKEARTEFGLTQTFFYCNKIYITQHLPSSTFLSIALCGIKYVTVLYDHHCYPSPKYYFQNWSSVHMKH